MAITARRPHAVTRTAFSRYEPAMTTGMSVPPLLRPYETLSRKFPQPDAPVHGREPQGGAALSERRVQAARAERALHRERKIGGEMAVDGVHLHVCVDRRRQRHGDRAVHRAEFGVIAVEFR